MVSTDKIKGKLEEVGGKIKEGVGDATDNDSLEAEGKGDQMSGKGQQVGGDVKEGLGNLKDDVSNN